MPHVRIFLSAVTKEFKSYREALRKRLARPNVHVHVQEDFIATGGGTLDKLDNYIRECDAVVHLAGTLTGAPAKVPALRGIQARYPDLAERLQEFRAVLESGTPLSYTQWEAYLGLYHKKPLFICVPGADAPRDPEYAADDAQRAAQEAHLARLRGLGHHPEITFASEADLAAEVLRSHLFGILQRAEEGGKPISLPYPSLGTLFKGRDEFLQQLRESLLRTANGRAAIVGSVVHGLGGVGKTCLAVEYAWRHEQDYTALLFVGAETPQDLHRNVAALTGPLVLNLPEQDAPQEEARVGAALRPPEHAGWFLNRADQDAPAERARWEAAIRWLHEHPGWLLILDSVDTEEAAAAVETLLGQLHGGQVLITGQLQRWSARVDRLDLNVLRQDHAAAFLLHRTERGRRILASDHEDAAALACELDGLALALEQSGAYVVQNRVSLDDYLTDWRRHDTEVQAWHDPRLMQYPRSVAATWQATMERLGAGEKALLQLLSWMAPEPLPLFVLESQEAEGIWREGVRQLDPENEFVGRLRQSLVRLADYSMVRWDPAGGTVAVHRVVQEIGRSRLSEDERRGWLTLCLRLLEARLPGDPQDVRLWPRWESLGPHIARATGESDAIGIAEPTARLMSDLAGLLQMKGLYAEAERLCRRALAIDERNLGTWHPHVAIRLNNLATLLQRTNRFADAEPLIRRALEIDERNLGPDHPHVGLQLGNLAKLLQDTGRAAEAEALHRRALEILRRSLGEEHLGFAVALNDLGSLLKATNRPEEAERLLRRAVAIFERTVEGEHPYAAVALSNLAMLLHATGRVTEAEPLARRALETAERILGPEHPTVARCLSHLAGLLHDTNRLADAEPLCRRALGITERNLGPEHPDFASQLDNLARLLRTTGRADEAERLVRRALAIEERTFGPNHPNVAIRLNNLAGLLRDGNRVVEAEALYRRALQISEQSLGPDHPSVATCLNNLAELLRVTNRLAEAEPLSRRTVSILAGFRRRAGHEHPHLRLALGNYAAILRAMGRSEAEVQGEIQALIDGRTAEGTGE